MKFAIQAWSPYLKRDIECLEKVQRRANWLVKGVKKLSYEDSLQKLGLTTPAHRRIQRDHIEAYKIITGKEKSKDGGTFWVKRHWLVVTIYEDTVTSWPQDAAVWRFDVPSSVDLCWVRGISCRPTSSRHLLSTLSRTVTTRRRVGNHKADASTPDIYKYKYKYKYSQQTARETVGLILRYLLVLPFLMFLLTALFHVW